ncbi:MAG: GlmU family protein [Cyclobacteriaceae bacterium]
MNIIFFDHPQLRKSLLPLTYTRPVAGLRVGIFTIAEKWEQIYEQSAGYITQPHLTESYPGNPGDSNLLINGAACPSSELIQVIDALEMDCALMQDGLLLALRTNRAGHALFAENGDFEAKDIVEYYGDAHIIRYPWDIFKYNAAEIVEDFELVTKGRISSGIQDKHTIIYNEEQVFVESGVVVRAAVINAEEGPVYIGQNAHIHEGAKIKGPFALCEGSFVNMDGKIRGGTTIGPYCKVGGEINNAVIFGNSNKGHEGFLGNAVVGEWCNFGADTNNSNLKNNYGDVKLWSYEQEGFVSTGLQFCGLIMGDHSKCGINTMFNTGTVVGVSANIFGADYQPNFIPSFSWGGVGGAQTFQLEKAIEVAQRVIDRRGETFDAVQKSILEHVFHATAPYRTWETTNK